MWFLLTRSNTLAALLVLYQFSSVWAQSLKIDGPDKIEPYRLVRLEAVHSAEGAALIWDVTNEDKVDAEESGKRFWFVAPPGTYNIKLRSIVFKDGRTEVDTARKTITIGKITPGPEPDPDPEPGPDPGPKPQPAPIPVDGFRALFVFESGDLSKYPKSQIGVLYGKEIRDYLASHCVKGPDGKTPEGIFLDQNDPTGALPKHWQDAMARPRTKLPWLIVSNGKTGYEGPLPLTIADTLKILKQYGGN